MKKTKKILAFILTMCVMLSTCAISAFAGDTKDTYKNEEVIGQTINLDGKTLKLIGNVTFKNCTINISNVDGLAINSSPINLLLDNSVLVADNCTGFLCAGGKVTLKNASILEVKNGKSNQVYAAGIDFAVLDKSLMYFHDNKGYALCHSGEGGYTMTVDNATVKLNKNSSYASNGGMWNVKNNSNVEISDNGVHGASLTDLVVTDSTFAAKNNGFVGLNITGKFDVTNSKIDISGSNTSASAKGRGDTFFGSAATTSIKNSEVNLGILAPNKMADDDTQNRTNFLINADDKSVVTARCADANGEKIKDMKYTPSHDYKEISNVVTKEPTTKENGIRTITYQCTICKDEYEVTEEIPALVVVEDDTPLAPAVPSKASGEEKSSNDIKNSNATVEIKDETPLAVANTADNNSVVAAIALLSSSAFACYAVVKKKYGIK